MKNELQMKGLNICAYAYVCSGEMVKVVSLSNEAYATLKKMKSGKDSFSDVVLRLSKEKKGDVRNVFGVWKGDKEIEKIFDKILKERHEYKPVRI